MKRIRGDHITGCVSQYLRRRRYSSQTDESEAELEKIKLPPISRQSVREMALNKALHAEGSTGECISYCNISGDTSTCDQQYGRFRKFITESVIPYKSELSELLYPIFIHVFLELIINGHKSSAHKFYERYHDQLLDQTHRDRQKILDALKRTQQREDVHNNQVLSAFRDHKYLILMKSETLDYLLRYLKSGDNMLLLQVFNQYLSVQVKDLSGRTDFPDISHRTESSAIDRARTQVPSGAGDVTMESLQTCIQKVRSGPPCVSSVQFYTFINTGDGLSTCAVSPDQKVLSAGFESSVVKVWALTPQLLSPRPCSVNVSRIELSCDQTDNVNQEESKSCELVEMRGHCGPVYKTVFLPDSRHLLSCSEDRSVRLWSLDTFTNIVCYTGHNYPVWNLDVSDTGCFASCSQDKTARLWSTDRTYPLKSFIGHTMDVECVKFHPNGNYLATCSDDKTIRLWSVQEARAVRVMQGHRSSVQTIAFSPDGQLLASAGVDRRVRIWDLSSGQVVKDLRGHTDVVYSLSFSEDGSVLASGGLDSTLKIWDVKRTVSQTTSQSESSTSPELLASFSTKSTSVLYLNFARHNVLLAAGAVNS